MVTLFTTPLLAAALCSPQPDQPILLPLTEPTPLAMNISLALLQDPQVPNTESRQTTQADFGKAPARVGDTRDYRGFYTILYGIARDGDPDTHHTLAFAATSFLAKDLEAGLEVNAWLFDQEPDTEFGLSASFIVKWHFLHGSLNDANASDYDWTIFAELGIGAGIATDAVPTNGSEGGSDFNLFPRAGLGGTLRLGSSQSRLTAGLRWHHMSNARISGDDNNPDFNAPLFYIGVQRPF